MRIVQWRPKRVLKLLCLVSTLCLAVFLIYGIKSVLEDRKCSEEESRNLIAELCHRYEGLSVDGNFCYDLCESKSIKYSNCLNYRRGKKVFLMECDDTCEPGETVKTIMKKKSINKDELDHLILPLYGNGSVTKEGLKIAQTIMENKAYGDMHFSVPSDQNIFTKLWTMDFDKYVKTAKYPNADHVALLSIWSLIQQDEYFFMKVYQHLPYVPVVYGSCGEYYFTEYAPPGEILTPGFLESAAWSKRADAALKLLTISQALDTDFHEHVHFCDIKEENFGVGIDLEVKIIDSDSLFFDEKMSMNLRDPNCSRHIECDFFDCRGWCDQETKKCVGRRLNNNLQNICEDIFIDRATNFFGGLLRKPPASIAAELITVLDECAYPNKNKAEIVRAPTSTDTYWKLYNLLKSSLKTQNTDTV